MRTSHRHARPRRRLAGRRPGHRRAGPVGRHKPRASCRSRARGSPAATTTTRARPSRSPPTGGSRPATWPTIDAEGYLRLVDRTKDVVKSGGEWISSVELENEIMGAPRGGRGRRHRRAPPEVVGAPVGVRRGPRGPAAHQGRAHRVPRAAAWPSWWLPDDVVFIDEIPKTSVGKFSKKDAARPLLGPRAADGVGRARPNRRPDCPAGGGRAYPESPWTGTGSC